MLVEEESTTRAVLYRSECKNPEELASHSRVQDVLHSVVLVEVGRTLRNVDVGWNDASRTGTGKEPMSDIDKVVTSSQVSAVNATTRRNLEMVKTTSWLSTRTPHTATRSGHDNVRK
jgi:hypothetical protein